MNIYILEFLSLPPSKFPAVDAEVVALKRTTTFYIKVICLFLSFLTIIFYLMSSIAQVVFYLN